MPVAIDTTIVAPPQSAVDKLAHWWAQKADQEIKQTVAKAVEYGSTDLADIGHNIARLSNREVTDQEAAELGIYFYLEGKLARWRSAIKENRQVSADTLLDIGVYVRMAQRVREVGSWPGVEDDK
jgi:metal-dependent amidase/aminoacylase/carboxypeptidase family protein